jgi:hypothetical protein
MPPRTRGANAIALVDTPDPNTQVAGEISSDTPRAFIGQDDIVRANGTDHLPRYLLNWDETQRRLREPFDPVDIYFLPQTVDYKNNTAIAAAYADSRVYSARMNAVIGMGFWTSDVTDVTVAPFAKVIKARLDWKKKDVQGHPEVLEPARDVAGHKVGVTVRIGIWMGPVLGVVYQDSTGAKDTADENWITTGEAQAYKRAMSKFGPGEYLYHFAKQSCGYDIRKGGWQGQPRIPDWAYPNHDCAACGCIIDRYSWTDRNNVAHTKHFWDIVVSTRKRFGQPLCPACAKKAQVAQTTAEAQQRRL